MNNKNTMSEAEIEASVRRILVEMANGADFLTALDEGLKSLVSLRASLPGQTARRVTAFQVGPDPEEDFVCTEDLLMSLGLAGTVFAQMFRYIEVNEATHGNLPDDVEAPNNWAISGAFKELANVAYVLKAGAYGFENAHRH